MNYYLRYVQDHVEVYTLEGIFLFSADTQAEALHELSQSEAA